MKIGKSNVVITDVPGLDSITVEPSPGSLHEVHAVIAYGDSRQGWGYAELTAYRDALTAALAAMREIGDFADVIRRSCVLGDLEPGPEVTRLRDADGDFWVRSHGGCWALTEDSGSVDSGSLLHSWDYVRAYAPLMDVTDA